MCRGNQTPQCQILLLICFFLFDLHSKSGSRILFHKMDKKKNYESEEFDQDKLKWDF